MSDRLDELGPDVDVALVTFTTEDELGSYQRRRQLRFDILLDPNREAYAAYGIGRGSLREVWGWATVRRYLQILRRSRDGRRDLSAATDDTRQLGADVIVGPDGALAWAHWSGGPADRPTVDEIVTAVRSAQATAT